MSKLLKKVPRSKCFVLANLKAAEKLSVAPWLCGSLADMLADKSEHPGIKSHQSNSNHYQCEIKEEQKLSADALLNI